MTTTTNTPPVTFMCSRAFLTTITLMLASTSVGKITLGLQNVVLPLRVDSEGHDDGFCWPHKCTAATTTSVLDAFSGICYGSSAGEFLFQSWASHRFLYHVFGVWYGVCFRVYSRQAYVPLGDGPGAHTKSALNGSSSHFIKSGAALCFSFHCAPDIPAVWWSIQLWGLSSHLIPPPSLHGGERFSFPGSAPPRDTPPKPVFGFKPSNSSVVITYQDVEFIHTWLAEHFIAWPHI